MSVTDEPNDDCIERPDTKGKLFEYGNLYRVMEINDSLHGGGAWIECDSDSLVEARR